MKRKQLLLGIFWISFLPILLGVNYSSVTDSWQTAALIGRIAGMWGVILLVWQMLLGIRELAGWISPDLVWVNSLHKRLGKYGFLLIAIHPLLIILYYASLGLNLLLPSLATPFDRYKALGLLALALIGLVWLFSALLRHRLSFRWWKRIHLVPYFAIPLVFIHSFNLANALQGNLRYYWYLLVVLSICLSLYRLFTAAGFFKSYYQVVGVIDVSLNVRRFVLASFDPAKKVVPQPGQFIYLQSRRFGETHPFTISHYDSETGQLSITTKAAGLFTQELYKLQAGDKVFLTGPYGVFTREAYTTSRPIVVIAGGIGITPFLQMIEKLKQDWYQQITLFYGNRTTNDIAYGDYLAEVQKAYPEQLKLVNVLSNQPDYDGERGFIGVELIEKYLISGLTNYEYFVCGPPIMMDNVTTALINADVPKSHVHTEKFSL